MVRLDLLLVDNKLWHDDVPRIMQGAVRCRSRGAWATTIANAWGTLAIEKFARAFESLPVTGTTTASLAAASQQVSIGRTIPTAATLSFAWPPAQSDLHVDHAGSGNPWARFARARRFRSSAVFERLHDHENRSAPVDTHA